MPPNVHVFPPWFPAFFWGTRALALLRSAKAQRPNGGAHGTEELVLQGRTAAELDEGHREDVGEEQQQHQGEEPQAGRRGDGDGGRRALFLFVLHVVLPVARCLFVLLFFLGWGVCFVKNLS